MSSTTPNLGLTKTTAAETIGQNWAASNESGGNFDIIDTKMGAVGNQSVQAQLNALNSKLVDIFVNKGTMADNANFNDFVTSGAWKNSGTNTGQTNAPSSADNGYLIVAAWQNGQRASQIWISAYTGSHKKRNYNGTSWSSWTDL